MKKYYFSLITVTLLILTAGCSKDNPTPEVDQEEISTSTLTFTEVERELHNDHYHYNAIENAEVEVIKFDAKGIPPVGAHLDLEEGKTYKVQLSVTDFNGRETAQTFVDRHDIHQIFFIGAPEGALEYVYADRDKDNKKVIVGVTGYLTVVKESTNNFTFEVILRHLNKGVKENVTANDWNNKEYLKFAGATDLHLKFDLHLVKEGDH